VPDLELPKRLAEVDALVDANGKILTVDRLMEDIAVILIDIVVNNHVTRFSFKFL